MSTATSWIQSFLKTAGSDILEHASEYYDPVKAHEYYERTKELKGRRSGSGLKSQKQKEGWSYTQSRVKEAKDTELDAASDSNKQAVEQLRANGEQRRKAISEKIKKLMEQISGNVEAEIAALPKGLSKADRAEKVKKIREKAGADRESERGKAGADREQVRSELKTSIATARDTYKKARDAIAAKYEEKLNTEYDAIRTSVR